MLSGVVSLLASRAIGGMLLSVLPAPNNELAALKGPLSLRCRRCLMSADIEMKRLFWHSPSRMLELECPRCYLFCRSLQRSGGRRQRAFSAKVLDL